MSREPLGGAQPVDARFVPVVLFEGVRFLERKDGYERRYLVDWPAVSQEPVGLDDVALETNRPEIGKASNLEPDDQFLPTHLYKGNSLDVLVGRVLLK
jgi:hypothetical protein